MSESADLRIASKRTRYDNNKPYRESETITLYIYNAGPDEAMAPAVKAGYAGSMNYKEVTTTIRQAQEWHQPSQKILAGSVAWNAPSNLTSREEGDGMVTILPDVPAGTLVELNLSFPMTRETSYEDHKFNAAVLSTTYDPYQRNNETTYTITPNHHNDDSDYWNAPGHLDNLDYDGLTTVTPLSKADLRLASARSFYNNNLPLGQSETLTFFIFNDGPTIATRPTIKAGYTYSMDYDKVSCRGDQVWVPDGTNPSLNLENYDWKTLGELDCHIDAGRWDVICTLPDIPPCVLYRISIVFPRKDETSWKDYTANASVSSDTTILNPDSCSTTYIITPNHNDSGDAYWQTKGKISQLDGPSTPSGSCTCLTGWLDNTPIIVSDENGHRHIQLTELMGQVPTDKVQVMSYDNKQRAVMPKKATDVEYDTSSGVINLSFSADGRTQLSYSAHPDTLLYLYRKAVKVGEEEVYIGFWLTVRMLWVGAKVRGMDAGLRVVDVYVTDVHEAKREECRSVEPLMVSRSHSYVVGTLDAGGILTHNPRVGQHCGNANVPAIMITLGLMANDLVAVDTPSSTTHGYSLRHRRPTDPLPPRVPAPPVLPADVPRQDEEGNWLIYLYEEDTPAAVENARFAVEEMNCPSRLTYDPDGAPARRRRSTNQYQSQSELLHLTTNELRGGVGAGQLDRDEYPPAIAREGGSGAVVTYIEAGDNRRAGCLMGQQFTNYRMGSNPMRPGDTFRYAIIHRNITSLEYLGDGLNDETQIDRPPTND
ncbi:nuclease [Annulohypoxylon nitens]|nr:nuclease [Annulohypoxylon nitens]